MVNVAIAGGTGALGRTIVEVLQLASQHNIFILTRRPPTDTPDYPRTTYLEVDYGSIDALITMLEANAINTIICTFNITPTSLRTSQMTLIRAASAFKATTRFIPTSFAIPYPETGIEKLPPLKDYFACLEQLQCSTLEYSVVHNGIFMDYFRKQGGGMKSHLAPNTFAIDMAHHMAAIPGDGTARVTFTYTFDVARYLVCALDLPSWSKEMRIVGETLTWDEVVQIAEEVTGAKFSVVYDGEDKLRKGEITELPGHVELYDKFGKERFQQFMAVFEGWIADGRSEIEKKGSVNEKFAEVKTLGVKDFLEKSWRG